MGCNHMAFDHRCQKSILALLILAMLAGTAEATEFIAKAAPLSTGGLEYSNTGNLNQVNTFEGGGVLTVKFTSNHGGTLPWGNANFRTTPHFFDIDPTDPAKKHGSGGPYKVTYSGSLEGSSGSFAVVVEQAGGRWLLHCVPMSGIDQMQGTARQYVIIETERVTNASDGRANPNYAEPYTLASNWQINSVPGDPPLYLRVTQFWVHIEGGDGEGEGGPGGGGDGGDDGGGDDGGGDDGGGGPPNKDPGDNPDDDPPKDKPPEDDDDDPPGPPTTGITCIDELMEMFKEKFPKFDQNLTSGNDFWKVEWNIKIGEVENTYYWSTKPDASWAPGAALDKLRAWVRSLGILLMVIFSLRQIVLALRQW